MLGLGGRQQLQQSPFERPTRMPTPSTTEGAFARIAPEPGTAAVTFKYDKATNHLFATEDAGTTWQEFAPFNDGQVVELTDAATIAVDASLGKVFRVTLEGNRTLGVPTNGKDGQEIDFEITQSAGSNTLALASGAGGYVLPTAIANTTLSTGAAALDIIRCRYNSDKDRWLVYDFVKGYA